MNFSDSERITTVLENQNYTKASSKYEANLVVIIACAVRQHAVDRIFGNIGEIKKKNPKAEIIVTGCLLDRDRRVILSNSKNCEEIKKLEIKKLTEFTNPSNIDNFFKIKPNYQYKDRNCVPIMTGCNNFCSYCAVPYTRGREYSRPAEDIINEIAQLAKNGCKEITLLGQNVNSYASNFQFPISNFKTISNELASKLPKTPDKKLDFSQLLKLINNIHGNFKIKFLTSHPKDMSDKLIDAIFECDKVDKDRIHLPVQHGDNEILKKMNRKYTIEHYKNLIKKIRNKLPDIKITTDIIVGFPGETEQHFENTVKLFKEIGFSGAYISCYSPRPGTAASKLEDNISLEEKKKRRDVLESLVKKQAYS